MLCTAQVLHVGADILLGSWLQLHSSLPSSKTALDVFDQATLCLSFPNREDDTSLCCDLLGVQEAVFANTVLIGKTTLLMLVLSLQVTWLLCYYWNGIYANKNYVALFRN